MAVLNPELQQLTRQVEQRLGLGLLLVVPIDTPSVPMRASLVRRYAPARAPFPASLFGRMLRGRSARDEALYVRLHLGVTETELVWLRRRLTVQGYVWSVYQRDALAESFIEVSEEAEPLRAGVSIGGDAWSVSRFHLDDLSRALAENLSWR